MKPLSPGDRATRRRLVLLRHGRTAWNASGRAQGHADVELDELGQQQAAAVAPYLATLDPAALWTSDLTRARQTCAHLERATGLRATVDPRLREFDVGKRQGLTHDEFAEQYPVEHAAWQRADRLVPTLGGESESDVVARMEPALRSCLASLGPGETAVAVTHGAALKTVLIALLGWPAEHYASMFGMDNCAWATLEEGHGPEAPMMLLGYNESVRPGHHAPLAGPDEV